jgi:hypothetical protein
MPVISACPKCQKPVSIPAGVDLTASVRCPLCQAEYPLGEALPPELIPVAAATGAPTASESAWAADVVAPSPARDEHRGEIDTAKKVEEENEAALVARRVTSVGRVRRRTPKSALHTMIGVVTSGLAGLLVAYYGLAFWLGPQFKSLGFPNLPLSGWVTTLRGGDDAGEQTPPIDKPASNKPGNGAAEPDK